MGKNSGVERDRGKAFEAAHFARVEVGSEDDPAEQGWRHDRRRDELARPAGEHRHPGQATAVERFPQGRGLAVADRRVDRRDLSVGGDDEGAVHLEPLGGIAERGLHRRLVPGRDRGAKAEIARQQLGCVLQLMSALLPQAVIDRAARL